MWLPSLVALLSAMLLVIPLIAAYWFAPYLTLMHGVKPVAAMKASLMACIRNFFPMIVYDLAMLAIAIVAALPSITVIGILLTIPAFIVLAMMSVAGIYTGYRDMFTDEVSRPAAGMVTL
jgi:uncharacterized membrane protein